MNLSCAHVWLASLVAFATLVNAALFDDILATLVSATDCTSCHNFMPLVQTLAHQGDDAFVSNFTAICDTLKLEDPDVCAGAVGLEGPVLAHDLRQISPTGQSATIICEAFFGLCSLPPVNAHNMTFPKAAPKNPRKFTSKGRTPFQVMHISDVHIDRSYTVGTDANCTKNICCRDFPNSPAVPGIPAGPNGNSRCDSPSTLADSLYEAMNELGSTAKFSIFTGDVVEGATWLVTKSEVTQDLQDFDADMVSKIRHPIFPSLGADSVPVNSFNRNTTITPLNSSWVYDTQSAGWRSLIGANAANQVDHISGSYAVTAPGSPGFALRLIAINTQFWYKQNFWLFDSDTREPDPNGILAFIIQELQAAEDAGQRAWIFGHIPLGKLDALPDQSNYFDQIIQRYRNTIAGLFFGHSHKDQFEIGYSDYSNQIAENAVSIALIAPALTPTSGNPAFKLYDVDPDTFEVMDARVMFTNTSDPEFQTKPTWGLYYSARDTWGPLVNNGRPLPRTQSLSPAFWHNLTEVFAANDTAFQLFNTHISRGGAVTACDGSCKNTTICDMRAFRSENNCDSTAPGVDLRRSVQLAKPEFECERGIGHIFSQIGKRSLL